MRRTIAGFAFAFMMATSTIAQDVTPSLRMRMLAAEDARDVSPAGIAPLVEGLLQPDVEMQRRAVRALGRLEDLSLVPHIQRMLTATEASVRAEAANALAQAYHRAPAGTAGAAIARAALEKEPHALVQGALLLALGRFTYPTPDEWHAAEGLITDTLFPERAPGGRGVASTAVLLNGLRGLQALARQPPGTRRLQEATVTALSRLARPPLAASGARGSAAARGAQTRAAGSRVRLLALQALRVGGVTEPGPYEASLEDSDPSVRRVAMVPLMSAPRIPPDPIEPAGRTGADGKRPPVGVQATHRRAARAGVQRALEHDPSATVRLEALRGYLQQDAPDCGLVRRRLADASAHVALMAIGGMVAPCRGNPDAIAQLTGLASGATALWGWHGRAHALVTLAQMDHVVAVPHVRTAARDQSPWVRTYAARALRHLIVADATREDSDVALLRALITDADVNVATAAVESLQATVKHAADADYLAVLARDDRAPAGAVRGLPIGYGLTLAAVKGLGGTTQADIAVPLLDALDRLSSDARETSRDPRKAIIVLLAAQSDPIIGGRLRRYVADFDPEIARAAAALLTTKGATPVVATPQPLPRAPLPTEADLDALATTTVVLQMADGGRVTIALLPNEAPLNARRFVRLAESGFFTGRTIHRVVPNFVVQGGSPGANEYAGDGAFSRDEVGMVSNADGTVGLSTRGRDTGDAQFYMNLADNTRLDHTYTVFGVIEAGRDVVERWLEGDVITTVTVVHR